MFGYSEAWSNNMILCGSVALFVIIAVFWWWSNQRDFDMA